jgi:ABC-2 type transport system permease protein
MGPSQAQHQTYNSKSRPALLCCAFPDDVFPFVSLRNTISGLIVIGVSFLVGFQSVADPIEWMLVFGLAILFSLAISWISAIMGLLVKSMEAAQWTGFIVIFPLTFVSSAFVPTETMPYALQLFAENQPLSHVIEAIRAWLVGTPIGNSGWLAFAWCIGIIIVSMPIATWLFKRQASLR